MAEENNSGVAEIGMPGQVLSPNTTEMPDDVNTLAQFGTELPKPDAAKQPEKPKTEDEKRFEYWQSKADETNKKLKDVETLLAEKSKYDPLIDAIQRDDELFQTVQSHLSGNRTPDKPLEPPQKPDNYNEVEAFSNPESTSFKYRKDHEKYVEAKLSQIEKRNTELLQAREEEKALFEQQKVHQQNIMKFREELVGKGIPSNEFPEFWKLVNEADVDDMVGYYNYKKQLLEQPDSTALPRFDVPISSSAGTVKKKTNNNDVGALLVQASRRFA